MKVRNSIAMLVAVAAELFCGGSYADPTPLTCDFSADSVEGLIPADITFHATVSDSSSGVLTYCWDFDGDGRVDEMKEGDPTIVKRYVSCGSNGVFAVSLYVKETGGEGRTTETVTKADYIHLAPRNVYVSTASTGGIYPYETPTKAAATLFDVLKASGSGTTVHVAKGTYEYLPTGMNLPEVTRGVTVLGETGDPSDTVINCPASCTEKNGMLLRVNHPQALVAHITFQGGRNETDAEMAAGLRIDCGTVSNCVVRQCVATGSARHAGVWVRDGLLTHSIVEANTVKISTEDGFAANGDQRREQGAYIDGAGRIENCLFRNLKSDGGVITLFNEHAVVCNSTIVDCEVSYWTSTPKDPSKAAGEDNPRYQYPAYAIECQGKGDYRGWVTNTVIFNVTRKSDIQDVARGKTWSNNLYVPFSYYSQWMDEPGTYKDTPSDEGKGFCANCASTAGQHEINSTCRLITADDFVNYAGGDLTPRVGGGLFDAGLSVAGYASIVDLAGKARVVGDRVDIGCYEQQTGGAALRDVYVMSSYSGSDSDGSKGRPWKTIKEGCDHAIENGNVFVCGGPENEYVFHSYKDAAKLSVKNVRLRGCDRNWIPATNFADHVNLMAKVYVVPSGTDASGQTIQGYAEASHKIKGSTTYDAPISASAEDCVISGLWCEFDNKSFKRFGDGGTSLIRVEASRVTVENCWFRMVNDDGADDDVGTEGVISASVLSSGDPACDDCTIRRCYARMGKFHVSICFFSNLHNGTRVENCFFENLDTLFVGKNTENVECRYQIVSNLFLNCANQDGDAYKGWLIDSAGDYAPSGCEISYNLVVHNNGDTKRYAFLQHGRQAKNKGNLSGDVSIHHNTIVGYDIVFESPLAETTLLKSGSDTGSTWTPKFRSNLIVDCRTNFVEHAGASRWKSGLSSYVSSFKAGSQFYNNALLCDSFNGGSAVGKTWTSGSKTYKYNIFEKLTDVVGGKSTTITLDSMPRFINTEDPMGDDYYRLKAALDPWVLNGYVEVGLPSYIGAVKPQPGGFAVRIR